jgi:hypothetical protein
MSHLGRIAPPSASRSAIPRHIARWPWPANVVPHSSLPESVNPYFDCGRLHPIPVQIVPGRQAMLSHAISSGVRDARISTLPWSTRGN